MSIFDVILDSNIEYRTTWKTNCNPNNVSLPALENLPVTYFCTSCDIDIELKAENLRKPITKHEQFTYTTERSQFNFSEITFSEPNVVVNTITQTYVRFPFGTTYCNDMSLDDCTYYMCEEINKKYPNSVYCKNGEFVECAFNPP